MLFSFPENSPDCSKMLEAGYTSKNTAPFTATTPSPEATKSFHFRCHNRCFHELNMIPQVLWTYAPIWICPEYKEKAAHTPELTKNLRFTSWVLLKPWLLKTQPPTNNLDKFWILYLLTMKLLVEWGHMSCHWFRWHHLVNRDSSLGRQRYPWLLSEAYTLRSNV